MLLRTTSLLPRIVLLLGLFVAASCKRQEPPVQVSLEVSDSVTLAIIDGVTVYSSARALTARETVDGRIILTMSHSDVGTTFVVKAPEYHATSITWKDLTNRSHLSEEGLPDSRIVLRPKNDSREMEYVLDEMVFPGVLDEFDGSDSEIETSEQDGTGQSATRPVLESDGSDKPQLESEGRSR